MKGDYWLAGYFLSWEKWVVLIWWNFISALHVLPFLQLPFFPSRCLLGEAHFPPIFFFFFTQGLLCTSVVSYSHHHPILGWDQDLSGWWGQSVSQYGSILIAQCCGGPEWKDLSREASLKRVVNILDSVLFFFNLPKYINFIIEGLRKIRFCDRKSVIRIGKVLISYGNHTSGSRVVVCTQGYYLERWFSKFFSLLFQYQGLSLEDLAQTVLLWCGRYPSPHESQVHSRWAEME